MAESDDTTLTPGEMCAWLAQEVGDLTRALELRMRDATDFVTAYTLGKITATEAMGRYRSYYSRWDEPIPGIASDKSMTDDDIIRRLDQEVSRFRATAIQRSNRQR
jgi:hypothetical protein